MTQVHEAAGGKGHNRSSQAGKKKSILKRNKKDVRKCLPVSDGQSTDENSMTHSEKEFNPKRKVYFMLKELILQHNYRLDTYLACLKTLERMSGFFEHTQCRLMAIAILLSVAKLHEFRTPKYLNLLRWANCAYSTAELTVAQGNLLNQLQFNLPMLLHLHDLEGMEGEVIQLERHFYQL